MKEGIMKLLDYSDISKPVLKPIRTFFHAENGAMQAPATPPLEDNPGPVPMPVKVRAWWDVLLEQTVNSGIIAGIAALSSSIAGQFDPKAVGIAFGLTFLIELRKYRGLGK